MKWPRKSYAQMGEDLVIENNLSFYNLDPKTLTYLEVGSASPVDSNNTYLFYEQGARGVIVEPDPSYHEEIKQFRSEDTLLDVGIGSEEKEQVNFYLMTARTLNTFSKEYAEDCCNSEGYGKQKIEKIIQVKMLTINSIIEKYFAKYPNLISIDAEGLDYEILKSLSYQPEIICIEANYNRNEILKLMQEKKYRILCDNCLNIIFGKS